MEIAVIEYFPPLGYEVWVTDVIEVDTGIGSVFNDKQDALAYAHEYNVPILDISGEETPILEGEQLREFLSRYLEMTPRGGIIAIKGNYLHGV